MSGERSFVANRGRVFWQSVQAHLNLGHFFVSSLTFCGLSRADAENRRIASEACPEAVFGLISIQIGSYPIIDHKRLWITLSWFESMRGSHSTRLRLAHGRPFDILATPSATFALAARRMDALHALSTHNLSTSSRRDRVEWAGCATLSAFYSLQNRCREARRSLIAPNPRTTTGGLSPSIYLHPRLLRRCTLHRKRRQFGDPTATTPWHKRSQVYPRSSRHTPRLLRRTVPNSDSAPTRTPTKALESSQEAGVHPTSVYGSNAPEPVSRAALTVTHSTRFEPGPT
jgi:hypothetical protein